MIVLTGASGGIGQKIIPQLALIDRVMGLYNKNRPGPIPNVDYRQVNIASDIKSFMPGKGELSKITLIHLAAVKIDALALNYSASDWDNVMSVNLRGNFLLTQALLPIMISERWGRIIHITSRGTGDTGTIGYSASKAGLIGMSRVLAKEYARHGITSNVLNLGYFETGLYVKLSEGKKKELINQIPSKKLGDVSNIVNAVDFLIKSNYVNGSVINIDGGI